MEKIKPVINMRVRVIQSFSCNIFRGNDVIEYNKTFSGSTHSTILSVEEFIQNNEQKRLDLNNEEVWSKAYLPPVRTDNKNYYQGIVLFTKNI